MDIPGQSDRKILMIFHRYLEAGGEEGSVARIAETMKHLFSVEEYYYSTREWLQLPFAKLRAPFLMRRNGRVLDTLRRLQDSHGFDFWQVHNVFPGISVALYELAAELKLPLVQYLHNYRFGCPRATYHVQGAHCTRCGPGRFLPSWPRRCWRGSLPATIALSFALKRFWSGKMPGMIHLFIALSEAQKKMHVKMGIPKEKIRVIHHFLDADTDPAPPPPLGGDVLFLGRITEEKGVGLLLESWKKLDPGQRKLRIVGDGPLLPAMKRRAEELGLRRVVFTGFLPQSEHAALWRDTSVVVVPSVWMEPFGMVVLEAWRQARPVVATSMGSFPELIENDQDGWLADPNPDAFSEALRKALQDGDRCIEFGRRGRRKLVEEFNRERWLRQISAVYEAE